MTKRYVPPPNWPAPPAGWTPPPGWQPDPRWGPAPKNWIFWRDDRSWVAQHPILTGLSASVLAIVVIGSVASGSGDSGAAPSAGATASRASPADPSPTSQSAVARPLVPSSTTPPKAEPPAVQTPSQDSIATDWGAQPEAEREFVRTVMKAQDAADAADNDLQRGAALSKRNQKLCGVVKGGKAQKWTGKIDSLDANGDGFGIVSIEITDDVHVSTWNNAFSDYADHTLIEPGRLLDDVLELEEGQVVTFDGRFMKGDTCVNDSRLTLTGKLGDPDFIFRFSAIRPS